VCLCICEFGCLTVCAYECVCVCLGVCVYECEAVKDIEMQRSVLGDRLRGCDAV